LSQISRRLRREFHHSGHRARDPGHFCRMGPMCQR